jgi:hypothetical protein
VKAVQDVDRLLGLLGNPAACALWLLVTVAVSTRGAFGPAPLTTSASWLVVPKPPMASATLCALPSWLVSIGLTSFVTETTREAPSYCVCVT